MAADPSADPPGTRSAYAAAGVDIDAQAAGLREVKELARATFTDGVLTEIGSFGGLFRPDLSGLEEPVLVASADGVGTKLMIARMAGDYSTVGRDLVNHCVNDVLVQGARPLFFLDYVGAGVLEPKAMVSLVAGVARGCRENGCALLGGETAEMPGFYREGDYELVGFVVGLVDRKAILPRAGDEHGVRPGDVLVGLPSAGLHTNGYSLARKVLFERLGLGLGVTIPNARADAAKRTVGELLLSPHLSYLRGVVPLLGYRGLHALAHVTGGGLTDNLPRVLPSGTHAAVRFGTGEVPELFHLLQEHGEVDTEEMLRVFNMGVGMVLVMDRNALREALEALRRGGQR
ncbi:MAG TPA: phosphoribosylformylglycinamidine cyclo-ligase, partial [Thermoanaerobaculia bacterium]|nr:phosphoribosylformylglycinamidine cyclo-ligase [Thermoanaerobaculia bacterium]